jgi:pimeloyl-ACP methyl ester carboxylesterase
MAFRIRPYGSSGGFDGEDKQEVHMAFGYKKWLAQRMEELQQGSEVIQTAKGPVELERRGSASYVLFFHGGSSGYDTSFLNDHLVEAGFGCLSPSRPGHLRTPLSTGRTHAEQADAMAALLDEIRVEQVAVHGVSAGGPHAIQFAARHGDRTRALLLTSAITTVYPYDFPVWGRVAVGSNVGSWLTLWVSEKFPKMLLREALKLTSTYSDEERNRMVDRILSTPKWIEFFRMLTKSSTPAALLKDGFYNDLEQYEEINKNGLPLEQIKCPTLIVHGTADGDVKFIHAETAHRLIQNAELHRMEGAFHLVWLSDLAEEMLHAQVEFLRAHFIRPTAEGYDPA